MGTSGRGAETSGSSSSLGTNGHGRVGHGEGSRGGNVDVGGDDAGSDRDDFRRGTERAISHLRSARGDGDSLGRVESHGLGLLGRGGGVLDSSNNGGRGGNNGSRSGNSSDLSGAARESGWTVCDLRLRENISTNLVEMDIRCNLHRRR